MNRPKISVISPVYNVEAYLGQFIESMKAQTLDDLEIIFVDDCSPDRSVDMILSFMEDDKRVRLIRQEKNAGQGVARNAAIETARGEYFSFADPDDWVAPDFYELLYNKAKEKSAPVVKGKTIGIDMLTGESFGWWDKHNRHIRKEIAKGSPLYAAYTFDHLSAIFQASLFEDKNIRFGLSRNGEDTTFLLRVLYDLKELVFEDEAVYYYRQNREGASTMVVTPQRIRNELISLTDKILFLIKKEQDKFFYNYILGRIHICMVNFCYASVSNREVLEHEAEYIYKLTAAVKLLPGYECLEEFSAVIRVLLEHAFLVQPLKENFHRERIRRWTDFLIAYPDEKMKYVNSYATVLMQSIRCYARRKDSDLRKFGYRAIVLPQIRRLGKGYLIIVFGRMILVSVKLCFIALFGRIKKRDAV